MLAVLIRKLRQVAADPVLRRYLAGRASGRWAGPQPFTPGRPPYLGTIPAGCEPGPGAWPGLKAAEPLLSITLPLPGQALTLRPGDEHAVFDRPFDDGETLSALHRFAWLPLLGEAADPAWVQALWRVWRFRFAGETGGPAWECYSAAERVCNLLDLGRRGGLPEPVADTVEVLAAHAPVMAATLEYEGEHATHNHLANNGRGLYRLGVELGMPEWAELGAEILRREAERLFGASGMLREGSSHYQLLYVRNYADVWLTARRQRRPEEREWAQWVERLMAPLPALALPGGLALVGDVSPDSPPSYLAGLLPGGDRASGWMGLLGPEERTALLGLAATVAPEPARLEEDGWLRRDLGKWSGLWHAAPGGWSFCPGHGHQDAGSFELHYDGVPVIVDPGRGAYGEDGEAAAYRSAAAHSGLQLDGFDPYPANKPYYPDAFRRAVGGPTPTMLAQADGVTVSFDGFARLKGVGRVARRWAFTPERLELNDRVEGRGRRRILRRLVTPLEVRHDGAAVILGGRFRVTADAPLAVRPAKRWVAYGVAEPASFIEAELKAGLPWTGRMAVEVL